MSDTEVLGRLNVAIDMLTLTPGWVQVEVDGVMRTLDDGMAGMSAEEVLARLRQTATGPRAWDDAYRG